MRGRAVVALLCVVSSAGGCLLTTSLSGYAGPAIEADDAASNDAGGDGTLVPPTDAATVEGGASRYASAVLADEPVLYWRLGEKNTASAAHDSSKAGRDGTFVGPVQCGFEGAIAGDPDTACRFDGTTSAVIVEATGLVFAANVPYAIEAWVRPTSVTASHPVFAVAGHDVVNDGYLLLVDTSARAASVRETSDGLVSATGSPITLGTWEHVVGVNADGALRLYVNGAVAATSAATSPIPGASNIPFTVGADGSGSDEPFIGDIDEVAVYDHALSAAQVAAHYQAAQAVDGGH